MAALGVLGGGGQSRKEADDVEELDKWMFNIKSNNSKNKLMSGVNPGSFGKKAQGSVHNDRKSAYVDPRESIKLLVNMASTILDDRTRTKNMSGVSVMIDYSKASIGIGNGKSLKSDQ